MNTTKSIFLLAFLMGPLSLSAQEWSKEEQEFLDYLNVMWDELEQNNEATHELWKETMNPREDLTWWFTNQSMPMDLPAIKKWHKNWQKIDGTYSYFNVRPIEVKIEGDMAMVWYYFYGEWWEKDDERHYWEDQRFEVFKKDGSEWIFLGGMVHPVVAFE